MDLNYYILKDKVPIKTDLWTWARWLDTLEHRIVGKDTVGVLRVSTVFVGFGLDTFNSGPDPLLFETMIFPDDSMTDSYCERYAFWCEAEEGHKRAVQHARAVMELTNHTSQQLMSVLRNLMRESDEG